jgi:hypothetical protein
VTVAADAAAQALAGWRLTEPPPTLREFTGRLRYPGGPLAGAAVRVDSDPVHAWIVDQRDSGNWDSLAWCATAQVSGKTTIGIMAMTLHGAIGCRLPVGYALPTLQDLDKAWTSKLKRQFVDTGFEKCLPTSGPGARGGRGPSLQLYDPDTLKRAGQLGFCAGGAYGDTFAVLCVDEADQFRKADGSPDWPAIEDLRARTGSYGSRAFTVFVGTLETNKIDNSVILTLADEQGTGTRPWVTCPECGRAQRVTGHQLTYDPTDEQSVRESARIGCQHCPAQWDAAALYVAQRKMHFVHKGQTIDECGKLIGPAPRTRSLGLVQNAYAATIVDLPQLAVKRWNAQRMADRGETGSLRKFWWYQECEPLAQDEDEALRHLDLTTLTARSAMGWSPVELRSDRDEGRRESHSRHIARDWPEAATYAAGGVDVQDDRLYWALTAAAVDGSTWDMGWGYEFGSRDQAPLSPEQFAEVMRRIDGLFRQICGPRFVGALVDVGDGGNVADLIPALSALPAWHPADGKGDSITSSTDPRDAPGYAYLRRPAGWRCPRPLVHVPSNSLRAQVQAAYLIPVGRPGAAHLPSGCDGRTGYIRHLIAEQATETKAGNIVWRKRPGGGRHDWLDARIYSRAGCEFLRPGRIQSAVRRRGIVGTVGAKP